MIFTIEPSSNRIIATIPDTDSEKIYLCTLSVCSSPTCGCENVQIDFLPENIEDGALPTMVQFTVEIDLTKWRENGQECHLASSEFAASVQKNMDEGDYAFLMGQFLSQKSRCIEEADFNTLVAYFPKDDFEKGSPLVSYSGIIPHAESIIVEIKGRSYWVDDQYCVKPNCGCSEAHLSYFAFNKTQTEGEVNGINEVLNYSIDYKKRAWKKFAGEISAWSSDDDMAKESLESMYPGIWQLVQTRHSQLKQVYVNSMKRQKKGKPSISSGKIGRNDACPCGSGKKYKKCCGQVVH